MLFSEAQANMLGFLRTIPFMQSAKQESYRYNFCELFGMVHSRLKTIFFNRIFFTPQSVPKFSMAVPTCWGVSVFQLKIVVYVILT